MAKGRKKRSFSEDQDERHQTVDEEPDAGEDDVPVGDPDRPICPRCGWHNTRLSHTRNLLDSVLRAFSLRAFRCRSCGNRFRAIWREPKD